MNKEQVTAVLQEIFLRKYQNVILIHGAWKAAQNTSGNLPRSGAHNHSLGRQRNGQIDEEISNRSRSNTMMTYKGYQGAVSFDDKAELLHGEVQGLRDVVTFQGRSVEELKTAFQESVDDYLAFCRERDEEPDKAFSGKFVLRVDPQLHRNMVALSSQDGTSLNNWVSSKLQSFVEHQRGEQKGG